MAGNKFQMLFLNKNDYLHIVKPELLFPAASERSIEIYLAKLFLNKYYEFEKDKVVEVGAVTPYYLPIDHDVIDPGDETTYSRLIKEDAEFSDLKGKNVLCISTIEHMGKQDYGEKELDPEKCLRFYRKICSEAKNFLVTWPVGATELLDKYFAENIDKNPDVGYCFFIKLNQDPSLWTYSKDIEWGLSCKYGSVFPNGNAIVCIYNKSSQDNHELLDSV